MGKKNKVASGAMSGAAAGSSFGPWGAAIGGVLGGLAGSATGGDAPDEVKGVDPAFLNSLYNQSMGTEKTAADMKMKAAFDQTLAQQVAAARASRGVNPALMQRQVARAAQEQGAKAVGMMAEENLKNQDNARTKYLQALQLNQQADALNVKNKMAAEERDSKELGSLINSVGAIGSTFATANAAKEQAAKELANKNANKISDIKITPQEQAASDQFDSYAAMPDTSAKSAQLTNAYTMGANQYKDPRFSPQMQPDAMMYSDKNAKTKIKNESDLVVVSDERQKDLIKNESLPANGNLGMQNQQAVQPQPMQVPQQVAAPVAAPMSAPAAAPVAPPAAITPAQTALAQANQSLAKGGKINDLQVKGSELKAPSEGPSKDEILAMSMDAQRRQTRDLFGNVTQSDAENYQANLARWYAKQAEDRATYQKDLAEVDKNNMGVNQERMARLSKFYTGNSNANANDVAAMYMPKAKLNDVSWGAAQQAQAAAGIGDQSGSLNAQRHEAFRNGHLGLANQTAYHLQDQTRRLLSQSDERSKDEIAPQSKIRDNQMNPKSFLDKLSAYSYEYKEGMKNNPNAGAGPHLSVMAQDLEKAGPVGQSMVKTDPSGLKQVDYGKGFGAILAAQVQLNERLAAIESKKGKGK